MIQESCSPAAGLMLLNVRDLRILLDGYLAPLLVWEVGEHIRGRFNWRCGDCIEVCDVKQS
jgi:hypothetical protein